jgi:hypothetical protein
MYMGLGSKQKQLALPPGQTYRASNEAEGSNDSLSVCSLHCSCKLGRMEVKPRLLQLWLLMNE